MGEGGGAGSWVLATDRLVGTGGVPASWRHVILIANTLECRCFHQQNHHNTIAGGSFFDTLLGLCQEMSRGCQSVCLTWLGCVKLVVDWDCVSECQTGGGSVSASVRQWHPMCQLTPGQNVGQNIDFTISLHRWRFFWFVSELQLKMVSPDCILKAYIHTSYLSQAPQAVPV